MSLVIDNKLPDNNLINDKHDDVDNDEVDNKNNNSHAEGTNITALGGYFYTEDSDTEASGDYSHSSGHQTIANQTYQTVVGKYNNTNDTNANNSLFVVLLIN